jgi:hypothetical protein
MKKIMPREPGWTLPGQNNIQGHYFSVLMVALTFCATEAGSGA